MFKEGQSVEDLQEDREKFPDVRPINIYAIETTRLKTSMGFTDRGAPAGGNQKIEQPQTETSFYCEGVLYPTKFEHEDISMSMRGKTIEDSAENFAAVYRERQNKELQRQKKSSYSLVFSELPERAIEMARGQSDDERSILARQLSDKEQEDFLKAFTKANEKATEDEAKAASDRAKKGRPITPPPPIRRKKRK